MLKKINDFFRNLKYGLRNFWVWSKLIYNDRDWDFVYLYQIIELKLLRMAQLHRKYGVCENAVQVAEELEEAAACLKRLYEDEYYISKGGYSAYQEKQQRDLDRFCELFNTKSMGWWD